MYAKVTMGGKKKKSTHEIVEKEKKLMLALLSHLKQQKLRPQCMISALVQMENASCVSERHEHKMCSD